MPIRANISTVYLMRLGIVACFSIGFSLWFLYDGLVAYPAQRARALKYEELKDLSPGKRTEKWKAITEKNGWPPMNPGEAKTEGQCTAQVALSAAVAPFGLVFLFMIFRNRGRWIEATDQGLASSQGDDFSWDQIVELNKRQWQKKGIARLYYETNGTRRKVVLDDCNYERVPTNKILRLVENKISHDLITRGPPEPPLDETVDSDTENQSLSDEGTTSGANAEHETS